MARKKKDATEEPNGNSEPKPVESKADKFRRLANLRLPKVLKAIRSIERLGNTATYEYTEEQKSIVLRVLNGAVNKVLDAFEPRSVAADEPVTYV